MCDDGVEIMSDDQREHIADELAEMPGDQAWYQLQSVLVPLLNSPIVHMGDIQQMADDIWERRKKRLEIYNNDP